MWPIGLYDLFVAVAKQITMDSAAVKEMSQSLSESIVQYGVFLLKPRNKRQFSQKSYESSTGDQEILESTLNMGQLLHSQNAITWMWEGRVTSELMINSFWGVHCNFIRMLYNQCKSRSISTCLQIKFTNSPTNHVVTHLDSKCSIKKKLKISCNL